MMLDPTRTDQRHVINTQSVEEMLEWIASKNSLMHKPIIAYEGVGQWAFSFEGDVRLHRSTDLCRGVLWLVREMQKDGH